MHTDRLQKYSRTHSTQLFVSSLSHTNCLHPVESLYIQKVSFPRTEKKLFLSFYMCMHVWHIIKQCHRGVLSPSNISDSNRSRTWGVRFLEDKNGKWHRVEMATQTQRNGEQTRQTPNPTPLLLTLTPHFHFYGLLPSAKGLLQHCDTQWINYQSSLVLPVPQPIYQPASYITDPLSNPLLIATLLLPHNQALRGEG